MNKKAMVSAMTCMVVAGSMSYQTFAAPKDASVRKSDSAKIVSAEIVPLTEVKEKDESNASNSILLSITAKDKDGKPQTLQLNKTTIEELQNKTFSFESKELESGNEVITISLKAK